MLNAAGTTYADEAGIRLKDQPMPLFQLLTLCMLASKPIDATIATSAVVWPRRSFICRWTSCAAHPNFLNAACAVESRVTK